MHLCMYIRTYVIVHAFMYVYPYVCICMCLCICMLCIWIIVHVQDTNVNRTHMLMHAYLHAYIHTLVGSGPLFPQSVLKCLGSGAFFRRILFSIQFCSCVCVWSATVIMMLKRQTDRNLLFIFDGVSLGLCQRCVSFHNSHIPRKRDHTTYTLQLADGVVRFQSFRWPHRVEAGTSQTLRNGQLMHQA